MLIWAKYRAMPSKTTKWSKSEPREPLGTTKQDITRPIALKLSIEASEIISSATSSLEALMVICTARS